MVVYYDFGRCSWEMSLFSLEILWVYTLRSLDLRLDNEFEGRFDDGFDLSLLDLYSSFAQRSKGMESFFISSGSNVVTFGCAKSMGCFT